jgi:UDP-3-O-[3-hydroxymyristoyl] glucosamine N-acyltransferase
VTTTPLTAQAVADLVGGRLLGHGGVSLTAVGPLDRADGATLSLLSAARYLETFRASAAGAVLLRSEHAEEPGGPVTRIVVDDPAEALLRVVPVLLPEPSPVWGVHPTAVLGAGAAWSGEVAIGPHAVLGRDVRLGAGCRVGPGAVLEDGVIAGDGVDIGPNVVCHRGTRLGNRVRLKAGAVIGGDGYGFASGPDGHRPIRHVGGCVLEDDVQVGSSSCIDRGSLDDTVIGAGTKIDNLVHLAHNVRVGKGCLIMAGVGVAGSTRLGNGVILAGQVGVIGHLTLGDGVRVSAQSGIGQDVPARTDMGGSPARRQRDYLRAQSALYRVAKIITQLEDLVTKRGDRG